MSDESLFDYKCLNVGGPAKQRILLGIWPRAGCGLTRGESP